MDRFDKHGKFLILVFVNESDTNNAVSGVKVVRATMKRDVSHLVLKIERIYDENDF